MPPSHLAQGGCGGEITPTYTVSKFKCRTTYLHLHGISNFSGHLQKSSITEGLKQFTLETYLQIPI